VDVRSLISTPLREMCLENITQRLSAESYIPDWASFNLDTEPDGTVYKPDSILKLLKHLHEYNYTLLGLIMVFFAPKFR